MEKLIYPLWKDEDLTADDFREELVSRLGREIAGLGGVHGVRVTVADSAVSEASHRRMQSHPPVPDAVLSLWVDNAGEALAWEPLIDACVQRRTCYLVVEAEPLVSHRQHPAPPGDRVYGMCHVVFFRKPSHLTWDAWRSVWQGSHTQVAIDTQSTFGYRQNLVVRGIGEDTPAFDAIVEENFPPEAMTSDHAFYDTGGDESLLAERMTAMMESCARFIDFESIDVVPMSEYVVKPLGRN